MVLSGSRQAIGLSRPGSLCRGGGDSPQSVWVLLSRGYLFTEWGFRVGLSSWTFELDFRVGFSSWIFELDFRVGLSSWTFEFGSRVGLSIPITNIDIDIDYIINCISCVITTTV